MSEAQVVGTDYIVKAPDRLGGEAHIKGHRISVAFVVNLHIKQKTSVDEIARHFGLTLAEIYSALAYYYDHRDEIDTMLAEEDSLAGAITELAPDGSMDAREFVRFAAARGTNDPEMTVTEVASAYSLSTPVVRKAAINNWIPARKSGATWLIRRSDAEARWGKRASKAG